MKWFLGAIIKWEKQSTVQWAYMVYYFLCMEQGTRKHTCICLFQKKTQEG